MWWLMTILWLYLHFNEAYKCEASGFFWYKQTFEEKTVRGWRKPAVRKNTIRNWGLRTCSFYGGLWGFTSGFAWACSARWVSTLIPVNQPLMTIHAACLRTLSPLSVLKHALGRKCSLMATPSKRDSVNAQSSFKFRSVDSQTISFLL